MHITEAFNQLRAVAVAVGGFVGGHRRPSIGVLLIAGPLPPAATEAPIDGQSISKRR